MGMAIFWGVSVFLEVRCVTLSALELNLEQSFFFMSRMQAQSTLKSSFSGQSSPDPKVNE